MQINCISISFRYPHTIYGLFEELGRHANRGGSQQCPNCVVCKQSVEHVLFKCASYHSQRPIFWDYLKHVHLPDAFEAFLYCIRNFNKVVFCLGKKQGMLENDECTSWNNKVCNFCCWFGIEERRVHVLINQHAGSVSSTPLQSVRSIALNPMAVECD